MRTRIFALALILLAACGSEVDPPAPEGTSLPADTFRTVLVELALARVSALPDTQAWITRRRAILGRHGLEARDLSGFVEAYGRQDEVLESIYRELGSALDSLARERAAEHPEEALGADAFPSEEEAARAAARVRGEPFPADTARGAADRGGTDDAGGSGNAGGDPDTGGAVAPPDGAVTPTRSSPGASTRRRRSPG